jgi:hypothetical protein
MFITGFYIIFIVEYVNAVKNILFSTTEEDLSKTVEKYRKKAPDPLCKQFTNRRSKEDAIKRYRDRKALDGQALFPSCEYIQNHNKLTVSKYCNTVQIIFQKQHPGLTQSLSYKILFFRICFVFHYMCSFIEQHFNIVIFHSGRTDATAMRLNSTTGSKCNIPAKPANS